MCYPVVVEEDAFRAWSPEIKSHITHKHTACVVCVWSTSECWEERLQSPALFLAEFPWLTSADCLGSPLLRSSGHSAA